MISVKNKIILVLSIFETLLFSGVSVGFNSLIPIYKKAGVFSKYCEGTNVTVSSNITCPKQDTFFGRAYLIWLVVKAILCFLLGLILDRFGMKVVKVLSAVLIFLGFLCFAFVPNQNWLLYIAGILLIVGGHGVAVCNLQFSVLISQYQIMYVSLISSLLDASAFVMTVIKYVTDAGIPFFLICTSYGTFGLVFVFGGMFLIKRRATDLLPKKKDESKEEMIEMEVINSNSEENTNNEKVSTDDTISVDSLKERYDQYVNETFPSLMKCIMSPHYIIHFIFFMAILFRFTFFISQMTLQLEYLFEGSPLTIEHLQSVSNIFFLGSIIVSPILGIFTDKIQQKIFTKLSSIKSMSSKEIYCKVTSTFALPMFLCTCSMLIASLLLFVANVYVFYVVFICVVITRSIFFAVNASYLLLALPKKYFGTLIGLLFLLGEVFSLLQQITITFAAKNSHPNIINSIMVGLCIIGFIQVLYLKLRK